MTTSDFHSSCREFDDERTKGTLTTERIMLGNDVQMILDREAPARETACECG
jgi:hypothetical protein